MIDLMTKIQSGAKLIKLNDINALVKGLEPKVLFKEDTCILEQITYSDKKHKLNLTMYYHQEDFTERINQLQCIQINNKNDAICIEMYVNDTITLNDETYLCVSWVDGNTENLDIIKFKFNGHKVKYSW